MQLSEVSARSSGAARKQSDATDVPEDEEDEEGGDDDQRENYPARPSVPRAVIASVFTVYICVTPCHIVIGRSRSRP